MTEEVVDVPNEQVETEQVETNEPSAIEQRALEMGWRPREQFDGTDDDFIDAKEFVRRKPLFDKIELQGKQLKSITKTLQNLKEHYTKVNETAYERALADLKNQRKEALKNGDGDSFEAIDDRIKEVEAEKYKLDALQENVPQEQTEHPEFSSWKSRNRWYDSVGYMRAFADQKGIELHRRGLDPAEVLTEVEKAVRKEFPQKFTNPNKEAAPNLEKGGTHQKSNSKDTFELSEQERKIMNDFVRQKLMTKEEYIKSLKDVRGNA